MKTDVNNPKGVIGRSYEHGLPVIWKFVNQEPSVDTRQALPWLTVISWEYDGSDNNGMPSKAINGRMIQLENAIEDGVVKTGFCEHAISKTGSNLKELIYYIHDRDSFLERLNSVLKSHERYPIEITFYEDPEWNEHGNARDLFNKNRGEQADAATGVAPEPDP
jgi:hypothetical protein